MLPIAEDPYIVATKSESTEMVAKLTHLLPLARSPKGPAPGRRDRLPGGSKKRAGSAGRTGAADQMIIKSRKARQFLERCRIRGLDPQAAGNTSRPRIKDGENGGDRSFISKDRHALTGCKAGNKVLARADHMDPCAGSCSPQPTHRRTVVVMDHEVDFDHAGTRVKAADRVDARDRALPLGGLDFDADGYICGTPGLW